MGGTLSRLIKLVRYRFLLIAGLLPYGLGGAIASFSEGRFHLPLFLIGLGGLLFALIGVEAFNEFFDWHIGTDRVFQLHPRPVTHRTFFAGIAAFLVALIVAIFLTMKLGVTIMILSFIGFFAALFYLAPPVKLAYRGFGELVISLSYGPFMMLGSYYVQSRRMDVLPLFVSVIPALLLFGISILNQVPDHFQDRLVGKRNMCVRLGQRNVMILYGSTLIFFYIFLFVGLFSGRFPQSAWLILAGSPISVLSFTAGMNTYNDPYRFFPAIRYTIIHYVIVHGILIMGYIFEKPLSLS